MIDWTRIYPTFKISILNLTKTIYVIKAKIWLQKKVQIQISKQIKEKIYDKGSNNSA